MFVEYIHTLPRCTRYILSITCGKCIVFLLCSVNITFVLFTLSSYLFSCFQFVVVMYTTIFASKQCSVRLYSHLFCREFMFYNFFVFICVHWCSTRFQYQMMLVSFDINIAGVTNGVETANPSETHTRVHPSVLVVFVLLDQ